MKLTTGVVTLAMMVGTGWAQNPATIINNTKSTMQQVQQNQAAASNQALGIASKPAAAAPAKPSASAPAKSAAPTSAAKATTAAPTGKTSTSAAKTATTKSAPAPVKVAEAKPAQAKSAAPKAATPAPKAAAAATPASAPANEDKAADASAGSDNSSDSDDKKYAMSGKRDPFLSPVVTRQGGSGCSTGKKCLDIEAIAVRGVVRSDSGMIAVVTNGLNKAYFLRENDPVFNGYVVKITGDSVVFKETFQDKLGKPFTKDVVKKLTTPAV